MLNKQLEFIRSKTDFIPDIAIVLGSGLGSYIDDKNIVAIIDYCDIPNFPISTVKDHKGRFVFMDIDGKKVVAMQGRIHLYEGYSGEQLANPIRLMKLMGAKKLILTNAVGGINESFNVGDFMIIEDHISSFVDSPLIGVNNDSIGTRFPDMTNAYSPELNHIILNVANNLNIDIKKGVFLQFKGPCFETKAEIRMAKMLGADAVGMSTAIDTQVGVHCGLEVCAISVITNMACGISDKKMSNDDVVETANRVANSFSKLITEVIKSI